jgi:ketopantoate hydroxymethyltransferase
MLMKNREKISMVTSIIGVRKYVIKQESMSCWLEIVGMVMLGYDSTIPVRMKEMLLFTRAVARHKKER